MKMITTFGFLAAGKGFIKLNNTAAEISVVRQKNARFIRDV